MQTTFTSKNLRKRIRSLIAAFVIAMSVVVIINVGMFCIVVGPNWEFSQWLISFMMDTGAIYDGRTFDYGMFAIGSNAVGFISIGSNAVGFIAIGINAVGFIATGINAVGFIAVGTNAVAVIAGIFGGFGYGRYVLSITQNARIQRWVKGEYMLSPHRQDPEAIAFFTRWFPKLSELCVQTENGNIQ